MTLPGEWRDRRNVCLAVASWREIFWTTMISSPARLRLTCRQWYERIRKRVPSSG
jgi:hypothetical protein